MTYTVKALREALYSIIRRLGERPERYAKNPGRDFTRKRALILKSDQKLYFFRAVKTWNLLAKQYFAF